MVIIGNRSMALTVTAAVVADRGATIDRPRAPSPTGPITDRATTVAAAVGIIRIVVRLRQVPIVPRRTVDRGHAHDLLAARLPIVRLRDIPPDVARLLFPRVGISPLRPVQPSILIRRLMRGTSHLPRLLLRRRPFIHSVNPLSRVLLLSPLRLYLLPMCPPINRPTCQRRNVPFRFAWNGKFEVITP